SSVCGTNPCGMTKMEKSLSPVLASESGRYLCVGPESGAEKAVQRFRGRGQPRRLGPEQQIPIEPVAGAVVQTALAVFGVADRPPSLVLRRDQNPGGVLNLSGCA